MKSREDVSLLRKEPGDWVTRDMEKAVVFNDFFASVLTSQGCRHARPRPRSCTWVRTIPSTGKGWVENGLRIALRRRIWEYPDEP